MPAASAPKLVSNRVIGPEFVFIRHSNRVYENDSWDHSKTHCSGLNHCGSVINEQSFSMHLFPEPNHLDLAGVQHSPGNNKRFGWRCELSQAEPTVNCCDYGASNWSYATLIDNLPPNSRRNVNLSKQFR